MTRYIDMTPSWHQAAQILAAALENGTSTGRDAARTELLRMGTLLDGFVEQHQHDDPAPRFDVIAGAWGSRPAFGQSFATEADALAYAEALRGHGADVDVLPRVEAVSLDDALRIAADHFRKPELSPESEA